MSEQMTLLMATAASLGLVHTVLGPDHYLPFVVMARARKWSMLKTAWITFLCGLGHVGGSVLLGMLGVALGVALSQMEGTESIRGKIGAWLMISFGLVYFAWGLRRAVRNRPHTHPHVHMGCGAHEHKHVHDGGHVHVHDQPGQDVDEHGRASMRSLTPWILFTIFVFGPCEPLIPILMYPAATHSAWSVAAVAGVFGATTIGAMLVIVLASTFGLSFLPMRRLERYTHALAGATILACGLGIEFFGF